ncbi:sulfite exporter TauE/SafE family protein [Vibrio sp.]|uniref:sulfite exporter TauE/SafE family protein n=1 Tax=Vibrio sp. TaxID=678 RepID=UPI003D116D57
MTPDWLGAFVVGLLGSGHCMGMCGGIASMLSLGSNKPSAAVPIYYNFGRIVSYCFVGALVGGTVASVAEFSNVNQVLVWLRLLAALLMIVLACYIGRWWFGLLTIEKVGQSLWRFISPVGKRFLPIKAPIHALPFGFIWGWLPCGLVYSTLTWSAVSGSATNGALVMAAFGLGTLPAMLLVGYGASKFSQLQQSKVFRNSAAIVLLIYGVYTAVNAVKILLNMS